MKIITIILLKWICENIIMGSAFTDLDLNSKTVGSLEPIKSYALLSEWM